MILEFILWIVAYVLISESFFIYMLFHVDEGWLLLKIFCFMTGAVFMIVQAAILRPEWAWGLPEPNYPAWTSTNYIGIVWEVLVVGIVALIFIANKWIVKKVNER
jgi:hypothetical protein